MKAVVFAAGMGTRLKPFTDRHPKALVDIDGEAMLGHVLLKIKAAGISEVIVNVHHFASQIVDYLKARNDFGMTVHISDESALLLDTGGALALLYRRGLLENCDSVLVHNADIMTDFSLRDFSRAFAVETGAEAMLLVDSTRSSTRKLLFDRDSMCMCGWQNENTGQIRPEGLTPRKAEKCMKAAFGGVHIISVGTFADIAHYAARIAKKAPEADNLDGIVPFSITDYYIGMCRKNFFCAYQPAEAYRWFDVGRPESLEKARKAFAKSRN